MLRILLAGAALLAALPLAVSAPEARAAASDAYLQDYSAADGWISPSDGSAPGVGGTFSWSAQAVIDMDLASYSLNGFLESVRPVAGAPGGGYASLQHYTFPAEGAGDILHWRIPLAVDQPMCGAQLAMVFDDPDWDADIGSLRQYSDWTSAPGFENAFHRFTGMSGYQAHDDGIPAPHQWGTDGSGRTTLTIDLSGMGANTATVFEFTGTARPTPGLTGAQNIASGVAYGARLTVAGAGPMSACHSLAYAAADAETGATIEMDPVLTDLRGDGVAAPAGSLYALAAGAPAGAGIDPVTGAITWAVPAGAVGGDVTIPVTLTFPDSGAFASGSVVTASAEVRVRGPQSTLAVPQAPAQAPPPSSAPAPAPERAASPIGPNAEPGRAAAGAIAGRPAPGPAATATRGGSPAVSADRLRGIAAMRSSGSASAPTVTLAVTGGSWIPVVFVAVGGLAVTGIGAAALHLRGARAGRVRPRAARRGREPRDGA